MAANGVSLVQTTEIGTQSWALIEQYWRQGATVAQAIQAAREAAYETNS
jgi:hypothetical protein